MAFYSGFPIQFNLLSELFDSKFESILHPLSTQLPVILPEISQLLKYHLAYRCQGQDKMLGILVINMNSTSYPRH
jgi:hypothetical protein